jgi:hypothetical protein
MARFLARVAAVLLTFMGLLLLTRIVGGLSRSPAAAILGPNVLRQPQPCWYDICPGETSFLQAETILRADNWRAANIRHDIANGFAGPIDLYWEVQFDPAWQAGVFRDTSGKTPNTVVDSLALGQRHKTVRLGDLIAILGEPLYSGEMCAEVSMIDDVPGYGLVVGMVFRGNISVVTYKPLNDIYHKDGWRISPDMIVFYIGYGRVLQRNPDLSVRWRGFTAWKGQYHACGFLPRFPQSP